MQKTEIASLQRQNSQLQSKTQRHNSNAAHQGNSSESPSSDLTRQLESKSATVEAMELEISNLRTQLGSQSSSSDVHHTQIAALEDKLSKNESALQNTQRELTDTKQALTRASEKAVKEGVDKTSTETLIKSLQREVDELKQSKSEGETKTDTLEKKLQALGNVHRESEVRQQTRLREHEKTEKEVIALRKRLATVEGEYNRIQGELERSQKQHDAANGGADDEALNELEDEGRSRLERRIRQLEGEIFDLRRGAWRVQRDEIVGDERSRKQHDGTTPMEGPTTSAAAANNTFDDVDLVGGTPDHYRGGVRRPQHSSISTVLSSGIAAFTGGNSFTNSRGRALSSGSSKAQPGATRGSLELLSEENLDDDFDEAEFARAQAEEEARKRVEWAREIKRKLKDWNGWRLDLVSSRAGAEGEGLGEIFEI